jgi:predicted nucleic acid-binding Zn ribbon protein
MRATISFDPMPTYVYRFVETGETIEIQQSFSDPTLTEAVHPLSGATMPVKKVFQPVGITFKGGGFYKTDSRSGAGKRSTSDAGRTESATKAPAEPASGSTSTTAAGDSSAPSGGSANGGTTPATGD